MSDDVVLDDEVKDDEEVSEVQDYEDPYTNQEGAVKIDLYDSNKGKVARTGGPYQDELVAEEAEKRRAKLEGREPDYENPGPTAATQLVTKQHLVERDTDKAHYSDAVEVENEPVSSYVVEPEVNEPDPTQVDWDNDMDKVNAAEAKARLDTAQSNA